MSRAPIILLIVLMSSWGAGLFASPFNFSSQYNASGNYSGVPLPFVDPTGLALKDGKIYVADSWHGSISVLNQSDVVVDRIGGAGVGSANIQRPSGLFFGPDALYIADPGNSGVEAYLGHGQYVRVGPALTAGRTPSAVWVEGNTLWVVDTTQNNVLEYDLPTGLLTRSHLSKGLGAGQIDGARDIAMDETHIYIADTNNDRIEVFSRNWTYLDSIGVGRGNIHLLRPQSVTVEGGRVYVADTGNKRVVVLTPDGYPVETFGSGPGNGTAQFEQIISVRVSGNMMYALDSGNKRVMAYAMDWSSSAPAILTDIDMLNRTVSEHAANIVAVLDMLHISHAPFSAPAKVAEAYTYLSVGQYSQAAQSEAAAKSELDAVRLDQIQAVRAGLQKHVDRDWAVFDYYKSVPLTSSQDYRKTVLSNQVNDAQHELNVENYPASARLLIALDLDLAVWRQEIDTVRAGLNTTNKTVAQESPLKAQLKAQAAALQVRLDLLKSKAAALHQNDSYEPVATLIESGNILANVGDYPSANLSLVAAASELESLESDMVTRTAHVENASRALNVAQKVVNDSLPTWTSLGVDPKPITDKLTQAQTLIYSQPEAAQTLAEEALASAKLASDRAGTRGSAIGWAGLFVVLIIGMGIVVWFVFGKHKGMERL